MINFAPFFLHQVETSPHVQFVYDVGANQLIFVNAAYEHVLHGKTAQANAELPALLARMHPDDQRYLAHYWHVWVRGQMPDEVEVRLQTPEQPDQWFCLTPFYQHATDGRVLVGGTLRDISALKHHQENTDRFNSRKNVALEIVSHDLTGAFVMVQQMAQYLQEDIGPAPDSRTAEMLRVLEQTGQQSITMIRAFLQGEFLASVNTDLQAVRVEVGATLREPLADLQRAQHLLGHPFTYVLPAKPVYAYLDTNKFVQVLTNLVGNALKFTPDGGHVAVQIEAYPGGVRIHVRDDGIGIPAVLQPLLFERFTQARRMGLRGEESTGLGLALCKTIVEWHQGTITVVSAEGQGSTFTIELPQAAFWRKRPTVKSPRRLKPAGLGGEK